MTHKNDIVELECELISRLNQSRELFVQQLTDSAETDIVDRECHVSLMQSIVVLVDDISSCVDSADTAIYDSMAPLRAIREKALALLAQFDNENEFEDIFEVGADPI